MSGSAVRDTGGSQSYRGRNSTADRALDILLMFDDDWLTLSATEVAAHLDVARSTAYRYLQSLTTMEFLEENQGGSGFRLGPRVLDLARLARKGVGLSDLALPIMRELAQHVGQSVILTRRTGASVVCLERVEASTPIRLSYDRGQVLPVNAGAAALVLLAWAPEAEVEEILAHPLARFTDATITEPDALRARLTQIRADGIAVARGELDPDVLGVAAPVRANGTVVAAISIAALASRVPDDDIPHITAAVQEAADELSQQASLSGL